jgi:hypothetical protein
MRLWLAVWSAVPGHCPAWEPGHARDVEVTGDSVAIAGQELNELGHPVTFFLQRGEHAQRVLLSGTERPRPVHYARAHRPPFLQTITDQLDQL